MMVVNASTTVAIPNSPKSSGLRNHRASTICPSIEIALAPSVCAVSHANPDDRLAAEPIEESTDVRWFGLSDLPALHARDQRRIACALAPAGPTQFDADRELGAQPSATPS